MNQNHAAEREIGFLLAKRWRLRMEKRACPNVFGITDSFMRASCYAVGHEEAIEEPAMRK
jgi:hypothetical protein